MHTWQSLAEDLARLGLGAGAVVLLHSSYREIGPVENGAAGVLAAFDACAWMEYDDVDLDDSDFARIGADLDETCDKSGTALVTQGRLGSAGARLMSLPAAVDFAGAWIVTHRRSL